MIKLVNFRCESCSHDEGEYLDSSEPIPEVFDDPCPKCGGILKLFNFKDNLGRWRYVDTVRGD